MKDKIALFAAFVLFLSGCSSSGTRGPTIRLSPYFGSNINYVDAKKLKYCYGGCFSEKIGMVYTAKAGFIDTGHLIESVDRTKYVFEIAFKNIKAKKESFSFYLVEPANYYVAVQYPDEWTKKDAREVSIALAEYISHKSTIWHEIITWYGYSCVLIFSEKTSSFSWEDLYSDLLGSKIAALALKQNNGSFEKGVTKLIRKELKMLGAQKTEAAKLATEKIRGQWFSGRVYPFIRMMKRNFDTGLDDGYITPWLVQGVCKNNIPESLAVPEFPSKKGFVFKIELKPYGFQKNRILSIVQKKQIEPDKDYPKIIGCIKNQAKKEAGLKVDSPVLSASL